LPTPACSAFYEGYIIDILRVVTHPRFSDSELDDDGAVGLAEAFAEGNWPDLKELW